MPNLDHLENFFDQRLKIRFDLTNQVKADLQRPATEGEYTLPGVKLFEGTTLEVLGNPLRFNAKLHTALRIFPEDARLKLFPEAPSSAPDGQPWACFEVTSGLDLKSDATLLAGELAVALQAKVGGTFSYRHLLPAQRNARRRPALSRAVKTSRLPHQVVFGELVPGELHQWNRAFYFDFGLKAQYGQVFNTKEVLRPFSELPIDLRGHLEATLSAALGFGFYESMTLRVGRQVEKETWHRLRLERQRKRDLSLGLRLALQADYDFGGSSLLKVLDEALDTSPAQQVLRTLAAVQEASQAAADGSWDALRSQLSQHARRTLHKLFEDVVDLDRWLDSTPQVAELVRLAGDIVEAYESVDGTVRSWWNDLLDEAHLGADSNLRRRLEQLANLASDTVEAHQLADLPVELIESLTGQPLDPLLDILALHELIAQGKHLASQALALLDQLAAVPGDFIKRFQTFSERTGIAQAVDILSRFRSLDELKATLDEPLNRWLQNVAESLLGKVWEHLTDEDLKSLQRFATGLNEHLRDLHGLPDRLRGALFKLKGEFNLHLSSYFQTVTTTGSLIDIAFDPEDRALGHEMEALLQQRDAKQLLIRLAQFDVEEEPSYEILESVFTERRTTTGTLSLFSKFLSRMFERKFINQRTTASTTKIEGGARQATYVGGFERTLLHDSYTFQAGSWLQASASGPGSRLDDPFDSLDFSLELGVARTDIAITQPVIDAYHRLLHTLGFLKHGPDIRLLFDDRINHQARFSLRLKFSNDAVATLHQNLTEMGWKAIYVAAAQRWFVDEFTADRIVGHLGTGATTRPALLGEMLAREVARPKIQDFSAGQTFKDWMLDHWFIYQTSDEQLRVPGSKLYGPLSKVLWHRDAGFRQFGTLRQELKVAKLHRPEALLRLMRQAAKSFQRSSAGGWDNPMFNFWLLLALIDHQTDDGRLTNVRGLAQLSTRASKVDAWEIPRAADGQLAQWRLLDDAFDAWPPILG